MVKAEHGTGLTRSRGGRKGAETLISAHTFTMEWEE